MSGPRQPIRTDVREFPGMALDADPRDQNVAREQVNFESKERGSLKTRKGYRKVRFEA